MIEETEKRKSIAYRNYRSNFLIIWFLANIVISISKNYLGRQRGDKIVDNVLIILCAGVGIKLILATLFYVMYRLEKRKI